MVRPGATNVTLITTTITHNYLILTAPTFTGVTFTNSTSGPGTQAQKDAELGTLRLYRENGSTDVLLATATASGGRVTFTGFSQSVPTSGETFYVMANLPMALRDGDALDLQIASGSDVNFGSNFANSFPVNPAGSFPVDGMLATQIARTAVAPDTVLAGTTNQLVLNVRLPANGYSTDELERLSVVQLGSAVAGTDITALRLFADDGDGLFEPLQDALLGTLIFTGDRWQLTGLHQPVPLTGLRVFVAADIAELATENRTLRLQLPMNPDPGVGMVSGNDGPIDAPVGETAPITISIADRISWSANALPSGAVLPGTKGVLLGSWTATNRYAVPKQLTGLAATNAGAGLATQADRDREIDLVTLRADGDDDGVLDGAGVDPVLATATYQNGRAAFTGFAWSLAAGATRRLFVTADVSASLAADSDTLEARLAGPADLTFSDQTYAAGAWPLASQARPVTDGMAAASVTRFPVSGTTLASNDGPALALDVIVPSNGPRADVLNSVTVSNLGTAGPADVAEIRWWRDGGDGAFSAGAGDDQDLGAATWTGSGWTLGLMTTALPAGGARLFASVTVSGAPVDSSTLRLQIPVNGLQVASANDGPLDLAVANPNAHLLSNSPLLAALELSPSASVVGQPVALRLIVRNVGASALINVTPSALGFSGTGSLAPSSGPTPTSVDLNPGESDTLAWTFAANSAGDVRVTAYAAGNESPGGAPRRSLDAASNLHQVFDAAGRLDATPSSSLPASVNRGQAAVAALQVGLDNAGAGSSAPIRVTRLRLRLEDGNGVGLVPASLLSQASVHSGSSTLLVRNSLEASGSTVDLTLASPLTVAPGTPANLAVRFSILDTTTVANFRAAIVDSAEITAEDPLSGAPVTVRLIGGTPSFTTTLARVVASATTLEVASLDTGMVRLGRGQLNVPLLSLRLNSPGVDAITSDALVDGLSFELRDSFGTLLARPGDVITRVRVRLGNQVLATRPVNPSEGPSLPVLFSPALILPVNTATDLLVDADLSPTAPLGGFRLAAGDTGDFDAVDRNSRDRLAVDYERDPLDGRRFTVERTADTLRVDHTPMFPAVTRIGDTQVPVMRVRLEHPGSPGTARVRIDSLTVLCGNASHQPRIPADVLSRLRVSWNGSVIAQVSSPPTSGDALTAALPGPMLGPGDTAIVEIDADIAPTAAAGTLELRIFAPGLHAVDANLGSRTVIQPPGPSGLPLSSGLTQLQSPARDLFVGLAGAMPAVLAADGGVTPIGTLTVRNAGTPGSGSIRVDHLVLRAANRDLASLAAGAMLTEIAASIAGTPWAVNAALMADSLDAGLWPASVLDIAAGETVAIELTARLRSGASGSLRLGAEAAGIGVVQPGSALLQVAVRPEDGAAFPLWTEAGQLGATSLAGSYSNFPNPFAAGREATTFAYWLPGAGVVSLRIFTATGEAVARVIDAAPRAGGLHQTDRWDGRNGEGQLVRNGVYMAELIARYADGRSERSLRKVAVVR